MMNEGAFMENYQTRREWLVLLLLRDPGFPENLTACTAAPYLDCDETTARKTLKGLCLDGRLRRTFVRGPGRLGGHYAYRANQQWA
jgi:hypothetical protein